MRLRTLLNLATLLMAAGKCVCGYFELEREVDCVASERVPGLSIL